MKSILVDKSSIKKASREVPLLWVDDVKPPGSKNIDMMSEVLKLKVDWAQDYEEAADAIVTEHYKFFSLDYSLHDPKGRTGLDLLCLLKKVYGTRSNPSIMIMLHTGSPLGHAAMKQFLDKWYKEYHQEVVKKMTGIFTYEEEHHVFK